MSQILPFHGTLYDTTVVGDIQHVVDDAEQRASAGTFPVAVRGYGQAGSRTAEFRFLCGTFAPADEDGPAAQRGIVALLRAMRLAPAWCGAVAGPADPELSDTTFEALIRTARAALIGDPSAEFHWPSRPSGVPVGLLGELRMMALVRGVMARSIISVVRRKFWRSSHST